MQCRDLREKAYADANGYAEITSTNPNRAIIKLAIGVYVKGKTSQWYATRETGRVETIELWVHTRWKLKDLEYFANKADTEVKAFIDDKGNTYYGYHFEYFPISWLEDIWADVVCLYKGKPDPIPVVKPVKEKRTDFGKMYNEFEAKYNPYPVQMSRSEAFGHALNDGLIDKETYYAAHDYYGRLWNYVGD